MSDDGGTNYGFNRRKGDQSLGEFIGEMREWKQTSEEWRAKTDITLAEVSEFMSEIRAPRKLIVWSIRAVVIAALGGIGTGLVAWIKGHINFH